VRSFGKYWDILPTPYRKFFLICFTFPLLLVLCPRSLILGEGRNNIRGIAVFLTSSGFCTAASKSFQTQILLSLASEFAKWRLLQVVFFPASHVSEKFWKCKFQYRNLRGILPGLVKEKETQKRFRLLEFVFPAPSILKCKEIFYL